MAKTKQLDAETVAAAVFESRTKKEAAERLAISDRCLYDYLQSYEVQSILTAMRADRIRKWWEQLDDLTACALDALRDTLESEESSRAEKLRAASIVLDASRTARQDAAEAEQDAVGRLRYYRQQEFDRQRELEDQAARERGEMVFRF